MLHCHKTDRAKPEREEMMSRPNLRRRKAKVTESKPGTVESGESKASERKNINKRRKVGKASNAAYKIGNDECDDGIEDNKSDDAWPDTCSAGGIHKKKCFPEKWRLSYDPLNFSQRRSKESMPSDSYVRIEEACGAENSRFGSSDGHLDTCMKEARQILNSSFDAELLQCNENKVTSPANLGKAANVGRSKLDDASISDEHVLLDETVVSCPDSEFNDFLKDKTLGSFAVNQVWAAYANDGMPRYYARINEVISCGLQLRITWLEPKSDNQIEQNWIYADMPVSCGKFENGGTDNIRDHLILSHHMHCSRMTRNACFVYPREGEIWALFKDWDISWSSNPKKHKPPYQYEFVQVVSDFSEKLGIEVRYLGKLKGFVSLFEPGAQNGVVAFTIAPGEMYRFSHKIPSYKMTGKEREGVPEGSFELDPAALPGYLFELGDTGSVMGQTPKRNEMINPDGEISNFGRYTDVTPNETNNNHKSIERDVNEKDGMISYPEAEKVNTPKEHGDHQTEAFKLQRPPRGLSKKGDQFALSVFSAQRTEKHPVLKKDVRNAVAVQPMESASTSQSEFRDPLCLADNGLSGSNLHRNEGIGVSEESVHLDSKILDLHKCFEQAHAHASGILLFTLQWKELEDRFDYMKADLEERSRQVELREKEVYGRCKELESKEKQLGSLQESIDECSVELEKKEMTLSEVRQSIEDCSAEIDLKRKELSDVQTLIQGCCIELDERSRQVELREKEVYERWKELESKEKQLGSLQESIDKCSIELEKKEMTLSEVRQSIEDCSAEIDLKRKELSDVRTLIQGCCIELDERSRQVELREKEVYERWKELESKEKQLGSLQESIDECSVELEKKEMTLSEVRQSMEDCSAEIDLKRKELSDVRTLIQGCCIEHELAEEELSLVKKQREKLSCETNAEKEHLHVVRRAIEACTDELGSRKEDLELVKEKLVEYDVILSLKEEELSVVQKSVDEQCGKLEYKEKDLNSLRGLIAKFDHEVELKERRSHELDSSINECSSELDLKNKELVGIQELIEKQREHLVEKQKHLESMNLLIAEHGEELERKEEQYSTMLKSMEKISSELEFKRKELQCRKKQLKRKEKELQTAELSSKKLSSKLHLKRKTLVSLNKAVRRYDAELKSKAKKLDSQDELVKRSFQDIERIKTESNALQKCKQASEQGIESRKKTLDLLQISVEKVGRKLDVKKDELSSIQRSIVECSKVLESKREQLDLIEKSLNNLSLELASEEWKFGLTNGRSLQLLLNKYMKVHDLVYSKMSNALKASVDPALVALEAMHGFFPTPAREGEMTFDPHVIRRSCILILDQLILISPSITPHVHGEAIALANQWKAMLGVKQENPEEVLGFLYLLAAFHLAFAFSEDELRSFFDIVSHYKAAPSLYMFLGL